MLNPFVEVAGRAWLGGLKYAVSEHLAGTSWYINVGTACQKHGLSLTGTTLEDVVNVFRGKAFWLPDPVLQAADIIYPPIELLDRGGDDCDGWAMTHCQAVNYILGDKGWRAFIVSYLADPFPESHHFAVAKAPDGKFWVIQPQPTPEQYKQNPAMNIVAGPYATLAEIPAVVASWYKATVVWWDVRDGLYRSIVT
jgi:hypothetical protein